MKYWLMKNEPDDYSIDDLAAEPNQTDHWDGIRNYQVRNFFRDTMETGDLSFFYHSNCAVPGVVGVMRIVSDAYADHTAFDPNEKYYDAKSDPDNPRWLMVDVQLVEKFDRMVTLKEMRQEPKLEGMRILQRGNRLSVTPLTKDEWDHIVHMARDGG